MNSDSQEGHPNSRTLDHLLCNSHPVAYGWSWDFKSGRRVTYDVSKGFMEVYYTDKGHPMEGYPREMDEEELAQLLRAVLQLEGTMSKKMLSEIRSIFSELDTLVQDGLLQVDNTRGKEVDDDVLEAVREKAKKLNELLGILDPNLHMLPKAKRDEIAKLPVGKAATKHTSVGEAEKAAEVKFNPNPVRWDKPLKFK